MRTQKFSKCNPFLSLGILSQDFEFLILVANELAVLLVLLANLLELAIVQRKYILGSEQANK